MKDETPLKDPNTPFFKPAGDAALVQRIENRLARFEETLAEHARILAALQAQGVAATPACPGGDAKRPQAAPLPPKVHHRTARAMAMYAPEICDDECAEWADRLLEGRVYTKSSVSAQFDISTQDAQRVLFWLKRKKFLIYHEKHKGYILGV